MQVHYKLRYHTIGNLGFKTVCLHPVTSIVQIYAGTFLLSCFGGAVRNMSYGLGIKLHS